MHRSPLAIDKGFHDERLTTLRRELPVLRRNRFMTGQMFESLGIRDLTSGSAAQATEQATAQAIAPFVQQADVTLANGRSAKVFDSTKPLALAQQSPYRFALVSQSGGSEKILIKRLPVAAAGQCGMAVVNGVPSNVAEIYLNY